MLSNRLKAAPWRLASVNQKQGPRKLGLTRLSLKEPRKQASARSNQHARRRKPLATPIRFLIRLPFQEACFASLYRMVWKAHADIEGIWPHRLTGITCSLVWTWITDRVTSIQQHQPTLPTNHLSYRFASTKLRPLQNKLTFGNGLLNTRYTLQQQRKKETLIKLLQVSKAFFRCNYSHGGSTETNPAIDGPFLRAAEPAGVWQSWADRALQSTEGVYPLANKFGAVLRICVA